MGEPITLYSTSGEPVTVYGKAQRASMEAQGFSLTPPEPVEVEPEPEPAPKPRKVTKRTGNL